MMVRLYDYDVPAADAAAGIPAIRPLLEGLGADGRRAILTGLFKPERMPGTMERLTTLVEDLDASFANALVTLDNSGRSRRFVAIDEAKAILDRWLPGVGGRRRARVGRGPPARAIRRRELPRQAPETHAQAAPIGLEPGGADDAVPLPPHVERGMSRSKRRRGRPYQPLPRRSNPWIARLVIAAVGVLLIFGSLALFGGGR